jgi:perosamine synthetase
LFGNPVDLPAIRALCSRRGLALIEDCSHAHASHHGSRHVGTFGEVAIYSLGSSKMISGGHGGMLVCRDPLIRDLALLTGHFKPRTRTDVISAPLRRYAEFALGGNLRLSPIAAVLAQDHVDNLDQLARDRQRNIEILDKAFCGPLKPVRTRFPRVNATHFDVVYRVPDDHPSDARDELVRRLKAAGVDAAPPSTRPLNRVLRAIAAQGKSGVANTLLGRVVRLSDIAPDDEEVPFSVHQHDRMISLPAARLCRPSTVLAQEIASRASPVLQSFSGT